MMLSLRGYQKTLVASLTIVILSSAAIVWPSAPPVAPMFGPNAAAAMSTSHNWSGYTATSGTFTTVTGIWTVPQVSSSDHAAADAIWVGIGGIIGRDLIQGGTQNIINSSGQVSTTAFIEMLPKASQQIPVSVNGGDTVSVAVARQSSNQWQISFVDKTNGQTYNTTVAYRSSLSSAEWIEEDPSARGRLLPLDNFGTVQFSGGFAAQNGKLVKIEQANGQSMTMVNANCQALATPSALGSDGASFTITRSVTDTTVPVSGSEGSGRGGRRDGYGIGQYPGGNRDCLSIAPGSASPSIPPAPSFWGRWFPFFGRFGGR